MIINIYVTFNITIRYFPFVCITVHVIWNSLISKLLNKLVNLSGNAVIPIFNFLVLTDVLNRHKKLCNLTWTFKRSFPVTDTWNKSYVNNNVKLNFSCWNSLILKVILPRQKCLWGGKIYLNLCIFLALLNQLAQEGLCSG